MRILRVLIYVEHTFGLGTHRFRSVISCREILDQPPLESATWRVTPTRRTHSWRTCRPGELALLKPHLKLVEMRQQSPLMEGDEITNAWFPHSGVVSMVVNLAGGETVEVAMVGRESLFGASAAVDERNRQTPRSLRHRGWLRASKSSTFDCPQRRSARYCGSGPLGQRRARGDAGPDRALARHSAELADDRDARASGRRPHSSVAEISKSIASARSRVPASAIAT